MYFKIQFIVHAIIFYIIIIEEILFGNSASTLACIKAAVQKYEHLLRKDCVGRDGGYEL